MLNGQRGMSLAEILVAFAILGGIVVVIINGTSFLQKNVTKVKLNTESKDIVNEMINTLTASASTLQVDYSSSPQFPSELPIAWDKDGNKILLKDCSSPCALKGRMGVLITPTNNRRLFLMKIRITHSEWKTARVSSHILGY